MDHARDPGAAGRHLQAAVDLMQVDTLLPFALEESAKIVLFGGAGLVGQNLVILLKTQRFQPDCRD